MKALGSIVLLASLLAPLTAVAGVVKAPTEGLDQAYAPRRVALLIGVDTYGDPDLQSLSFAGKDARDMAGVLSQPGVGGFEVHVVTAQEATTHEGIVSAIERVTADLQRDDTFLLYLSGHGTLTLDPTRGTRLWFLPSDGKLEDPVETGVEVAWLEETLASLEARRRVLVLDTCHNGRSKSGLSEQTASRLKQLRGDPPAPSVAQVSESEARLYAAQYYQPAMEDPNLGNGVYTHFLLEALTTRRDDADLDRDGLVDVLEAHDFARDGTIRYTGGLQVPRVVSSIVGNEEIYLAGDPRVRRQAENALITAYDGILASARLLVDGTPRGELPGIVAIEPGRRQIEVRTEDGRTLLSKRVHVTAGEVTTIEDLLAPKQAAWTATVGVSTMHGAGARHMVPTGTEIELAWSPARWGWITTDLHARGSFASGDVTELAALGATNATTGLFGVGAFAGGSPWPEHMAIGPSVDLVAPYRHWTDAEATHRQLTASLAPGLRLRGATPMSEAAELVFRYDVRVVPWQHDAAWTAAVTHGAALGVSFR